MATRTALSTPPAPAAVAVSPEKLLTTPQAAAVIGLHPSYLAKARLTGTGPRFLKIGRAVRYRRLDVEAWLADKGRVSTSDRAKA